MVSKMVSNRFSEGDIKPWLRSRPKSYLLHNGNVVDVASGSIRESVTVAVEDGKIRSIVPSSGSRLGPERRVEQKGGEQKGVEQTVVDCTGLYLCPGLIDSHVHLMAVPGFDSLAAAFGNPERVSLLRQPYVCGQMLQRGFTTVRDCGGAHAALRDAIADGVFAGPRIFIAGHALSQSGGHADFRGSDDHSMCCAGLTTGLGRVCNGVSQCMQAVREEVRAGSDFIKMMGSGGVSSPTDRIDQLQFTAEEIRAMVSCARNAGTYVTAHAYTPAAIQHCIANGVRGIEHGNLLDAPTAAAMARAGVYLTPTLVTYHQMASAKWSGYLPASAQAKNSEVLHAGLRALQIAAEAGVTICFGTDLLGPLGAAQCHEFSLRKRVLSSLDVLRSATLNPARMLRRDQSLGQIRDGFEADILFLTANPLQDVTILDDADTYLEAVMKEGRFYRSQSNKALVDDDAIPLRLKAVL